MFKIGVGPSSSHTVGPMVAALAFRESALAWLKNAKPGNYSMLVELYGSLSLTGQGHQTDGAVCAGLAGLNPKSSQVADIWGAMANLRKKKLWTLGLPAK